MAKKEKEQGPMVRVTVGRLFEVMRMLETTKLADDVAARFAAESLLLPLAQAVAFKDFVDERLAQKSAPSATEGGPRRIGVRALNKAKAAVPLDFGHCTVT